VPTRCPFRRFCGYTSLEANLLKALGEVEFLSSENSRLTRRVSVLEAEKRELEGRVDKLAEDVEWFSRRVRDLTLALSETVKIPNISPFIKDRVKVEPYRHIKGFNLLCADRVYYALPAEAWRKILTLVHAEVKKILHVWKTRISDCDDWALLTVALCAAAFAKAGLDLQGALSIVWSRTHAFNAYTTVDFKTYVYEPQTDRTVGVLGETAKPYDSDKVWFPGEKQ